MINLAIIFGGKSSEHDISIITGLQLISKVNEFLYNIIPIYINKNGEWLIGDKLKDIDNYPNNLGKTKNVGVIAGSSFLYIKNKQKLKKYLNVDVAIICLHGLNGEDGTISAILKSSKIPYSNCDIFSSAVCMDKIIFNDICNGLNIPKVPYVPVLKKSYDKDSVAILEKIKSLGFPVILKPSRLGSSIGIEICKDENNLKEKLEKCFEYDIRIVVEKFIDLKKEVNIACFYNKNNLIFSKTEEPIKNKDYLDFSQKYTSTLSGMESMKRISPANIDENIQNQIKTYTKKLYEELGMFGVVRFDFMLDNENNLFVNEVNTIPGSMANYLFDDYSYSMLIEDFVSNALLRFEEESNLNFTYDSGVLSQGFGGFKK